MSSNERVYSLVELQTKIERTGHNLYKVRALEQIAQFSGTTPTAYALAHSNKELGLLEVFEEYYVFHTSIRFISGFLELIFI